MVWCVCARYEDQSLWWGSKRPLGLFPHTLEGSLTDICDQQFGDQFHIFYRAVNVSNGHKVLPAMCWVCHEWGCVQLCCSCIWPLRAAHSPHVLCRLYWHVRCFVCYALDAVLRGTHFWLQCQWLMSACPCVCRDAGRCIELYGAVDRYTAISLYV